MNSKRLKGCGRAFGVLGVAGLLAGATAAMAQPAGCGPGWELAPVSGAAAPGFTRLAVSPSGEMVLSGSAQIGDFQSIAFPNAALDSSSFFSSRITRKVVTAVRWDNGWRPLSQGTALVPSGLATLSDGTIVMAGTFPAAPGSTASVAAIARLNGSAFERFGGDVVANPTAGTAAINAIASLADGQLVVGGNFSSIGGELAANVARWDGQQWRRLGFGVNGAVTHIAASASGEVVVAGSFTTADGLPASGFARWNGTSWSAMPRPSTNPSLPEPSSLREVAVLENGDVIVTTRAFGFGQTVGRFRGGAWQVIGEVVPGVSSDEPGYSIVPTGGDSFLLVGRIGTLRANQTNYAVPTWLVQFAGDSWAPVATTDGRGLPRLPREINTGTPGFAARRTANGEIIAVGSFGGQDGVPQGVAVLRDGRWQGLTSTPSGAVLGLEVLSDGRQVALSARGVDVRGQDGWRSIGTITSSSFDALVDFARLPDDRIVVGGQFTAMNGVSAENVASWNGATWSAVAGGVQGTVRGTEVAPDGSLIVFGALTSAGGVAGVPAQRAARLINGVWTDMSAGATDVRDMTTTAQGDILAVGRFTSLLGLPPGTAGVGVARWDGQTWVGITGALPPDGSMQLQSVLRALPDGAPIVGWLASGSLNSVWRWDGSAWQPVGEPFAFGLPITARIIGWPFVYDLQVTPGGNLYITGNFRDASAPDGSLRPVNGIARLVGNSWQTVPPGLGTTEGRALAMLPDGRLAVAGSFELIGTEPSSRIAYITNPDGICPCSAADVANADGEAAPTGGADGQVTNGDFSAFFSAFFADEGDPARLAADIADADGRTLFDTPAGGPDGAVTNADFTAFFAAFFDGCGV